MEIFKAKAPENRWQTLAPTLNVGDSFILNTLDEAISAYINLRKKGVHTSRRSKDGKYQIFVKRIGK